MWAVIKLFMKPMSVLSYIANLVNSSDRDWWLNDARQWANSALTWCHSRRP